MKKTALCGMTVLAFVALNTASLAAGVGGSISGEFGSVGAVGDIFTPTVNDTTASAKVDLEHDSGVYGTAEMGGFLSSDSDKDDEKKFNGEWLRGAIGYRLSPTDQISIWSEAGLTRAEGSSFSVAGTDHTLGTETMVSKDIAIGADLRIPVDGEEGMLSITPFGEVRYHLPDEVEKMDANIFTYRAGFTTAISVTDTLSISLSGALLGHGESDIVKEGDLTDSGEITLASTLALNNGLFIKPEFTYQTALGDDGDHSMVPGDGDDDSRATASINIGYQW